MEKERDLVHQTISIRTELKIAGLLSTSRKGRSMVLHPTVEERGRCANNVEQLLAHHSGHATRFPNLQSWQ
jgi:hypothetical protein